MQKAGLCLVCVLALAMPMSHATVVYRETFATAEGVGNQPPGDWGWSSLSDEELTVSPRISGGTSAGAEGGVFPDDVNSNSRVGESIGAGTATLDYGFLAFGATGGDRTVLTFTDETPIDRGTWPIDSFSVDANVYPGDGYTTAAQDAVSIAINISGQWYLTAQSHLPEIQDVGGGGAFATDHTTLTFPFDSAGDAWRTLSVTIAGSSTTFEVGSAPLSADLPSGTIDAFGVYWDMAPVEAGSRSDPHWDNFTVTSSVPEPSSFLAFALGMLVFILHRRR